ncbi:MAG: nuclear transport factor 2 family protein [Alloacidobacterium sp.]
MQSGETGEAIKRFFTEDARQIELPNRLNPNGQESDLAALQKRSQQGAKILREQKYEIISGIAEGNRVAVEAKWIGILAIAVGALPAGAEMKAHFAMFFEMKDGKVRLQRNYDCFDPW